MLLTNRSTAYNSHVGLLPQAAACYDKPGFHVHSVLVDGLMRQIGCEAVTLLWRMLKDFDIVVNVKISGM